MPRDKNDIEDFLNEYFYIYDNYNDKKCNFVIDGDNEVNTISIHMLVRPKL